MFSSKRRLIAAPDLLSPVYGFNPAHMILFLVTNTETQAQVGGDRAISIDVRTSEIRDHGSIGE